MWVKAGAPAALLAVVAWWGATWHDTRANERRLGAIASQIAGRAVAVDCPGPLGRLFGWDIVEGSVRFDADGTPDDETKLRETACAELDALAEGRRGAELACTERAGIACGRHGRATAMAVDVLAHESWHLRGVLDEGETECRSLQTMAWTAAQLGADARPGRRAGARAARGRLSRPARALPRPALRRRRPARPAAGRPGVPVSHSWTRAAGAAGADLLAPPGDGVGQRPLERELGRPAGRVVQQRGAPAHLHAPRARARAPDRRRGRSRRRSRGRAPRAARAPTRSAPSRRSSRR